MRQHGMCAPNDSLFDLSRRHGYRADAGRPAETDCINLEGTAGPEAGADYRRRSIHGREKAAGRSTVIWYPNPYDCDPFQLPPVCDEESELLQHPDVILDEIVRQDASSAIPRLADKIRKGLPLLLDESVSGVIYQLPESAMDVDLPQILPWSGQIIAGRNATIQSLNARHA